MENFYKTDRTYIFDSDGVLANFEDMPNAVTEYVTDPNFFINVDPLRKNHEFVNQMIKDGYDVKILTASPHEQADSCKRLWYRNYVPNLKPENLLICRNTDNKVDFIKANCEDITKCVMIDDYTHNLIPIKEQGGKVIKYLNDYDNSYGKHTVNAIPYVRNIEDIFNVIW